MFFGTFFYFFLFFAFFFAQKVLSQDKYDNIFYADNQKTLTCQVFSLNVSNSDSIDAVVVYQYTYNNLTFEKSTDVASIILRGIGFVEVIFRDQMGIIHKIVTKTDTLFKKESLETRITLPSKEGSLIARIPQNNYEVEVNLYDKRIIKVKTFKTNLQVLKSGSMSVSTIIFVSGEDQSLFHVSPTNYLNFKTKDKTIIFGILTYSKFKKIKYLVRSSDDRKGKLVWKKNVQYSGLLNDLTSATLAFDSLKFVLSSLHIDSSYLRYYALSIPENFACPQKYICYLIFDEQSLDTLKIEFEIKWEPIPLSLRNIQYAIEIMYYILDDSEYKSLKDTRKGELTTRLFEIWEKFDSNKNTLFNEAMEVYFNRVDFAHFNFQTISEPDGAKTDRGKIFILYGKPKSIQRELDKEGTIREIWEYPDIHQAFVFTSKEGRFLLKEIRNF